MIRSQYSRLPLREVFDEGETVVAIGFAVDVPELHEIEAVVEDGFVSFLVDVPILVKKRVAFGVRLRSSSRSKGPWRRSAEYKRL